MSKKINYPVLIFPNKIYGLLYKLTSKNLGLDIKKQISYDTPEVVECQIGDLVSIISGLEHLRMKEVKCLVDVLVKHNFAIVGGLEGVIEDRDDTHIATINLMSEK